MDRTDRSPNAARQTETDSHSAPRERRAFRPAWIASGALAFVFAACGNGATPGGGTGGSGAASTVGGSSGTGGAAGTHATGGTGGGTGGAGGSTGGAGGSTGGTGGSTGGTGGSTGGTVAGVAGTGGSTGGTGAGAGGGAGQIGAGGAAQAGTGGASPMGGRPGAGGMSGGNAGTGQAGGGAAGSGGSAGGGSCEKGQVKPAEVVFMGESFYAIDPQYIQNRVQDDARKAGSLGSSDKYRNVAVSGQNMNYIATTEWTAATQGGASVKVVIMDGGGIDCLTGGSTCSTCASTFQTLLGKMATAGVQDVVYTRYPEPGNPPGSNTSLKACLDATMPNMQTTCEGSASPRCHWLDLRPVWVNGDTTDGLHPTESGGEHVGDLIWSELVKDCLAQ